MRITTLALLGLGLSLVACRGGDGDDNLVDPDAPPMTDTPPSDVRIQDIQSDSMPEGTVVSVKGVVVTAIDTFGNRTGDLWIQDPAGGEFSGVKVFGAPLDQVAALSPGDIVDVTGARKIEFALSSDTSGRKVTELTPVPGGRMNITKTGIGASPDPAVVDALAISMLPAAQRDAEWEKWEGVLVTVVNARQTTDVVPFGSSGASDARRFTITGGVEVQTLLTDFAASAVVNTCYAGITGIGDYFFNHLLVPRSEADLVTGGTECQASQVTTISAIQDGALGPVELEDVFVAAVSFNRKNLWLTTSLAAAPNEGIYVFRGNATSLPVLDAAVVVGARVNVLATAAEGNNDQTGDTLTQLTGPTITVTAPPAAAPVPVTGLQASTLVEAATGEPYESVLVTLTDVKVNAVGNSANFYVGELQQGVTTFLSDDDVLRLLPDDTNKCFDITGIWTYQIFENAYGLLPITKSEVTCP